MAAATPKTPSDAQPTSENITYEATLNAAASASRFPAGAFLDYAGLKKILEALAEMYATGDRPTEGLAYASLATTAAAPRGPTSFQVSSHEAFLEKLDAELAKCDDFAHREVVKVKRELAELESGGSRPLSHSEVCCSVWNAARRSRKLSGGSVRGRAARELTSRSRAPRKAAL